MLLSAPAKGGGPCLLLKARVFPAAAVSWQLGYGFGGCRFHSQVRETGCRVHAEVLSLLERGALWGTLGTSVHVCLCVCLHTVDWNHENSRLFELVK